ncbi:AI-2E family transporter [Microbacterium sp. SORGH_AS_0888]|uniref:AI-2E family transporter n=1 Tax=Microbacterium sp. SORGH_AS_0888 TaxID=3041791 RepID=UPI0027834B58|nr:AI-2E family transporter [Microbacterium sp. SORGH_AS_0888]MDQ1128339.1 putative PurR-regulated permease PerM [Microbacterium sp. SORGH_AS_0888]
MTSVHHPDPDPSADDPIPAGLRIGAGFAWRVLVIAAVLGLVLLLAVRLSEIVIPFFIGLILSALLVPLSGFLQRHGWPKWVAIVSAWVAVFAVITGLSLLFAEQLRSQLPALTTQVEQAVESARGFLATQPFGITPEMLTGWVNDITRFAQQHASDVGSGALRVGSGAVHGLEGVFIVIFVTLFMLIDGGRIWQWVTRLFPRRARPRILAAGEAGWRTLTSFIRIQLVVAATDAVGIGVGAAILGVPLAVPIAIIVFFGAFVPVVGAIVGGVVAVAIALVFNGWVHAVIMLGIVILVQQLESHVLHPLLTGSAVKVHPLGIVLGVTTGTTLAGIAGAFLAVPLIATTNSMIAAAHRYGKEEPEAGGEPGTADTAPPSGDR